MIFQGGTASVRGVVRPFARHFGKRNQWDRDGLVERYS